jgi:hypothetical protein
LHDLTNHQEKMKDQLPAFVLAELFHDCLVNTGDVILSNQPVEQEKSKPHKWYLGNNERKIVVLATDPDNIYLNDANLDFLTGILTACKLNLANIALVNYLHHTLNFQRLKKELDCEFLICFGITALQVELPFAMPDYQVQQYNNCRIITAPSLIELNQQTEKAKAEKTKLWKSLKKMFNL